ncbi:MAG: hypothetical protein KGL39_42210 [Patescibacteria group bacterium]|nr:hypothetical protein [Patescibacteria group bacterium]
MTKEEVSIQFSVNDSAMDSQLARMTGKVDQASMVMAESMVKAETIATSQILANWKKTQSEKAMMSLAESEALNARLAAIDAEEAEKEKEITAALVAEETALRVAAAKAQAAAQVAEYGKAMAAQAAMNKFSLAKLSIGEQIAGAGKGGLAKEVEETIAAGSIPANMVGGAERMAKEAEYAERLAKAGIVVGKGAHEMSVGAKVWTEGAVLVREGLRGNWSRMFGSFTILIGAIGSVVGVALGIVAAADGLFELLGGNGLVRHFLDYRKARAGEEQSGKDLQEKTASTAEMGETRVAALERAGIIDKKQAENFKNRLKDKNRTPESIGQVYSEINKLMPKGGLDELSAMPEKKRLDEEHAKKMLEFQREDYEIKGGIQSKLNNDQMTAHIIAEDMAKLDRNSIEYKKKQLELDDANRNVQKDQVELAKQKAEAAKKIADATREQAKLISEAQLRANETGERHDESFMPTLQELARAGGRFGSMARMAVQDEKRAKRDYMRGDVAGAHREIANRDRIYESLSGAGIIAESPEAREIKDLNKQLAIHFASMPGTPKVPAWIKPVLK